MYISSIRCCGIKFYSFGSIIFVVKLDVELEIGWIWFFFKFWLLGFIIFKYDWTSDLWKYPVAPKVIRLLTIISIIKIHKQPAILFFLCLSRSFLLIQKKHRACPRQKKGESKISVQDDLKIF